jgi:hypothetical protein
MFTFNRIIGLVILALIAYGLAQTMGIVPRILPDTIRIYP